MTTNEQINALTAKAMDALALVETCFELLPEDKAGEPHCRHLIGMAARKLEALSGDLMDLKVTK